MLSKTENHTINRSKLILMSIVSLGYLYWSFLTAETKIKDILTIDIPIASDFGLGFPIPVFFWLGVFCYLFVISKLMKVDFKELLHYGIVMGFFTHFIFLLLNLSARNVSGEIYWFSNKYLLYFRVVLFFALCILSIWSGYLLRLYTLQGYDISYFSVIYSIPFLFIYSSVVIFTHHNYPLLIFMAILFFISFYLSGRERAYTKIKEIFILLLNIIFNEKVFLTLIFLVSVILRIFFLTRVMTNPDYINTASDGGLYDEYARGFLTGESIGGPQNKGYWLFLALVYYLFGRDYFIVGVIQSLFGAASVILIFLVAKRIFGIVTARISSIIAALDYPLIFSAVGIGHEAMDLFYGIFVAYLLVKIYDTGINMKGNLLLAFTGIICGLAMANREVNILMPLVASGWIIYVFLNSANNKFKIIGIISLFLLFSLLGVAPFLFSNYITSGSLYPQSSTYGVRFILEHYNPQLTSIGFNPMRDFNRSIEIVVENPWLFMKAAWLNYYTKFKNLYFSQGYGGFDPIFLVRKPITNYYLSMWFYAYLMTFIGIISIFINKLKNRPIAYLLLLIIIYKTAFHLFTIAVYRYRAAIEPFIIIFSAYGLYIIIQFTLGSKTRILEKIDG